MGFMKEFREFALKGNVVDMAVGIVIGAAFSGIVKTLVDKVMMPPLGLLMGGMDFADKKLVLKDAVEASGSVAAKPEVAIFYGEFINSVINFAIVAFALFIVIKAMNTAKKRFERQQAAAPSAPPAPSQDVVLLTEIRDLLKTRG
ncbi:MAG: large-conductance mechanosensitive channel protein MscL [Phycisphaerales bacterium]|nr:large-conductance mechanosensitive channel protein MscL [Phycisphaerales bacterium]